MRRTTFFSVEVWTTCFLGTRARASALLELLETIDDGRWTPERWGPAEPIRKVYSEDSKAEITAEWTREEPRGSGHSYNDLMFRRKKPSLLIMAHAQRWGAPKLNSIWFKMEEGPFVGEDGPQRLKSIFRDLIIWSEGCYGSIYYSRQSHHRVVQMTPLERLEQAHWLNFFGQPYLTLFGRERILRAPCYQVEGILNLGLLLQATPRFDDPEIINSGEVLIRLEEYLGIEAFAGHGYPHIPCRVPDFDLADVTPNATPHFH